MIIVIFGCTALKKIKAVWLFYWIKINFLKMNVFFTNLGFSFGFFSPHNFLDLWLVTIILTQKQIWTGIAIFLRKKMKAIYCNLHWRGIEKSVNMFNPEIVIWQRKSAYMYKQKQGQRLGLEDKQKKKQSWIRLWTLQHIKETEQREREIFRKKTDSEKAT